MTLVGFWMENLQQLNGLKDCKYHKSSKMQTNLSQSDAEDSDIKESDDEDALEINNDEIGIALFYEDS